MRTLRGVFSDTFYKMCLYFMYTVLCADTGESRGLQTEKMPQTIKEWGVMKFIWVCKKSGMAEREGFEPSVEYDPHTRLAGEHHRPLGHLSKHQLCFYGGGSRIRTHGTFVQRFSRPPPSTTRPFLRDGIFTILPSICQLYHFYLAKIFDIELLWRDNLFELRFILIFYY